MSAKIDRHLALDALPLAARTRGNLATEIIFHSDRGSTYAATEYRKALTALEIICSMSNVGECLDNAVIESFNATITRELIDRRSWYSHDKVSAAITEYILEWYNLYRDHSSLGIKVPSNMKSRWQQDDHCLSSA